ncbi:MAG: Monoacylglycerol lipase [candidate division WS2 bacterium]|uniref:Monoacylglycerol lipase n=1 Tax=Psychracetigena formicireducens TaxID=2986056 RepID=A0A9E2BGT1_PSYF1|nr:Monoacylglycerol lipase [Candidatus Psychracetigena formicireducens]MBT9145293.1 Monoacylglycerol lipase [Candidatus Psychracetigena formicireducens]
MSETIKPAIIMIHGMWGGDWCFTNFQNYFEKQGYPCLNPILRYHDIKPGDKTDPRLGATSLLDFVADLETLIKLLPQKPIIMGHSMGGILAQMLGSRKLGKALILLAPAAPAGIPALTLGAVRCFFRTFLSWGFWRRPFLPSFNEVSYPILHSLPFFEQKKKYSQMVPESGRATMEIGLWFLDRHKTSSVNEADINCPVLIVAGAKDRITPASSARKMVNKYKKVVTYKEYPEHAHMLMDEDGWEIVADFVRNWIEQLPE